MRYDAPEEAEALMRARLTEHPGDPAAQLVLARALTARRKAGEAERVYDGLMPDLERLAETQPTRENVLFLATALNDSGGAAAVRPGWPRGSTFWVSTTRSRRRSFGRTP
ncbi:MAG: tetratricopeptide repeat protein [Deltaproteobacteria bacterium]|nr:tetratricopeptide repeat protein [Deltaproteobacteria bacterium]